MGITNNASSSETFFRRCAIDGYVHPVDEKVIQDIFQEKRVGDHVEISVIDSGVGIKSSDLKKLFNAQTHFSNLGTDEEKGVGIGLLLTKEFIEKGGGSIWVTSEVGKGSTFTFTTKRAIFSDRLAGDLVTSL